MIRCGDRAFDLSERCLIMGVLNVTPDSFSDGGQFAAADSALAQAQMLFEQGADIVDIGGESTNPYVSKPVDSALELERILPIVKGLVKRGMRALSIDTRHAETARICLSEGASWVNDVSAFTYDPQMVHVARSAEAVVLMHARGTPEVMQKGEIIYDDVVGEVAAYLRERVAFCKANGIDSARIIVDPGIGFGKRLEHNIALLRGLDSLRGLSAGVLSGVSRKFFLGEITGIKEPIQRDWATLGAVAHSVMLGANIVRVHNVKATKDMLKVFETLRRS